MKSSRFPDPSSPAVAVRRLWKDWWAQQDSNLQPRDYESPALTVELWAQALPTGPA